MSKCIKEVIEALKKRRDNLDAAIRILQEEAGEAEEPREEKKREAEEPLEEKKRGRPRKRAAAFQGQSVIL